MKLLIIDDHEVVRQGIAALAKREGLDVVGEAASKEEAIAMIASTSPDVITVDLSLPDGSGLEISKLNSQERRIIDELVRNAASHSKGHNITLEIGDHSILVKDDGQGMRGISEVVEYLS